MSWLYLPEAVTPSSASLSAPEQAGSTSDSPSHAPGIALCVTSSGKVTLRPFSWRGWKTRPWIKHLSGTTLPPSMAVRGVERWISSLAAIRASLFPSRASARGRRIPAIYGHTSPGSFSSVNQNGCFWKTSPIISTSVIARSEASWKTWATALRKDCLRRQKSARRINASGCSSSLDETNWPTPRASANENRQTKPTPSQLAGKHGMNLATKAVMWPTPQTDSFRTRGGTRRNEKGLDRMARDWPTPMASDGCKPSGGNRRSADLTHVAGMWPTPLARDWKGTNSPEHVKQQPPARNHMDQLANFAVYSRQAQTISQAGESICDQRRSLNPAFVEALMGWPTAWTDFDFAATAWSPWLQRMRSEFLRLGSVMMDDGVVQ
jgi:hypothetical protein